MRGELFLGGWPNLADHISIPEGAPSHIHLKVRSGQSKPRASGAWTGHPPEHFEPTTNGQGPTIALQLHRQLPKQKRINIRPVFNLFGNRLALAVAGLAINPQ